MNPTHLLSQSPYAATMLEAIPPTRPLSLPVMLPDASSEAVDFISQCITFSPQKRCNVDNALRHPYVAEFHDPEDEPVRFRYCCFVLEWRCACFGDDLVELSPIAPSLITRSLSQPRLATPTSIPNYGPRGPPRYQIYAEGAIRIECDDNIQLHAKDYRQKLYDEIERRKAKARKDEILKLKRPSQTVLVVV